MLYTKNKDCIRKDLIKVEHRGAHKHILKMVKQVMNRDVHVNRSQVDQNRTTMNVQQVKDQIGQIDELKNSNTKRPACNLNYKIEKVFSYDWQEGQKYSKSDEAKKQYIELLQMKINKLQLELQQNIVLRQKMQEASKQIIIKNTTQQTMNKLIRFYHKARNILVLQSVELLECRNIVLKLTPGNPRLLAISSRLAQTEQLLSVYGRTLQIDDYCSPYKLQKQLEMDELKELCAYQHKSIQFLRKQKPIQNQFNQIRLLRHQINRVCDVNQALLQKIQNIEKHQHIIPQEKQDKEPSNSAYKEPSNSAYKEPSNSGQLTKMRQQIRTLTAELCQQKDLTYQLREQKQIIVQMQKQLQNKIQDLQKQICQLKMQNTPQQKTLWLKQRQINSIEQLCRQLQEYPSYLHLLMSTINQYQTKIAQLQDIAYNEEWGREFNVMKKRLEDGKIDKILRRIRRKIQNMEEELQDYVATLQSRNKIIGEVQCEDGSSVAVSQVFTEQEFD